MTAIAQTIASSKICRAKFGTYTGTGLSGQNHPNSVECGFCPAALVLFRADGGQKTTVIRGVTACSSGIGSMNNYYTWGDSGVSWVSETLQSDSGGYMASSQFNSSGKEYCYLVLGYDADWIKQKTAPSRKLPTHKDNISNYRSSSIEKATDSELFRVSGFSLKTRLHSGTIYVYKRNFS